eukprot:4007658-Pleurochrysis_carterae.AAC.1
MGVEGEGERGRAWTRGKHVVETYGPVAAQDGLRTKRDWLHISNHVATALALGLYIVRSLQRRLSG